MIMDAQALALALKSDLLPPLSDSDLAAILGWLGHSSQPPEVAVLERLLGSASDSRQLTKHVFDQLDGLLFANGKLDLLAAGLAGETSPQGCRRRFRALMGAFHPDRFPWHAEWLTSRFQAVNQAYRDFKLNPDLEPKALQPVSPVPRHADNQSARYMGISPGSPTKPTRWRLWGRDRWLGHKIVGVLSLLVVLPLLSWSLEDGWLAGLFERDRMTEQEVSATILIPADARLQDIDGDPHSWRAPEQVPTVESLLEHWNLVLVADDGDADAFPTAVESPSLPHRGSRSETARTGHRASSDFADTVQASSCQPSAPAARLGGWLADAQSWSLKGTSIETMPSRLQPGAIAGHALADALENYRRSVETGNVGQLLRNYVEMPRANMQQGERWLQETYGALFSNSNRRSLSLDVIEAYRHSDGWNVVTQYRLGVRLPGCPTDHVFEQELRIYLVQDPLIFRIAAIDY